MCVGAVGSVGSGSSGIDLILIERYAALNKQLRLKRIKEVEEIESITAFESFEVQPINNISPEELREIYANPILSRIPIKVAYTVLQRLCDDTLKLSQSTEYLKPLALKMYCN